MKKHLFIQVFACLLVAGPALAGEDAGLDAFAKESRAMVKEFAGQLKGELQSAIASGGPIEAIAVCNVKAPEIAADLSEPGRWTIGRTSHKVRNPANAPDAWEAGVLEEFRQRAAAGESFERMEKAEVFEIGTGTVKRYMKAIPVGQVCLTCHGTDIDRELRAEIDSHYPSDQATGFALGELRGAFTITKIGQE